MRITHLFPILIAVGLTGCSSNWVVEAHQPGPMVEVWGGSEALYTIEASWAVSDLTDVAGVGLIITGEPATDGPDAMIEVCTYDGIDGLCSGSLVANEMPYGGRQQIPPDELASCIEEDGVCERTFTVRFLSDSEGATSWQWDIYATIDGLSETAPPEGMEVNLELGY